MFWRAREHYQIRASEVRLARRLLRRHLTRLRCPCRPPSSDAGVTQPAALSTRPGGLVGAGGVCRTLPHVDPAPAPTTAHAGAASRLACRPSATLNAECLAPGTLLRRTPGEGRIPPEDLLQRLAAAARRGERAGFGEVSAPGARHASPARRPPFFARLLAPNVPAFQPPSPLVLNRAPLAVELAERATGSSPWPVPRLNTTASCWMTTEALPSWRVPRKT